MEFGPAAVRTDGFSGTRSAGSPTADSAFDRSSDVDAFEAGRTYMITVSTGAKDA